ncbi:MAG: diaminopimelate epimerase, partial [Leeuwenhoekiella sp.]
AELDFKMVYYNSDGNTSTMCGNGGRCIVAFAAALGVITDKAIFEAIDGIHEARIEDETVHLKMQNVSEIKKQNGYVFLDTGSPHHIQFEKNLKDLDVKKEGAAIRYSNLYGNAGSNINFVENIGSSFAMRTYERGVEDETLSCGTGATAVAVALHYLEKVAQNHVKLDVEGGKLEVTFKKTDLGYEDIYLIGPAKMVFTGEWPS